MNRETIAWILVIGLIIVSGFIWHESKKQQALTDFEFKSKTESLKAERDSLESLLKSNSSQRDSISLLNKSLYREIDKLNSNLKDKEHKLNIKIKEHESNHIAIDSGDPAIIIGILSKTR